MGSRRGLNRPFPLLFLTESDRTVKIVEFRRFYLEREGENTLSDGIIFPISERVLDRLLFPFRDLWFYSSYLFVSCALFLH